MADQHQLPSSAAEAEEARSRARGRPQGSKNKPKPPVPVVVSRDSPSTLRSHVLEVSPGSDVFHALTDYARRRGRGLSVLYGSGAVDDVSVKQPGSGGGGVATLRGRSDILSITGNILPPPAPPASSGLTVFLNGGQGQVVGGSVVGQMMAASTVVMVAASFANAVYQRLPAEEEDPNAEPKPKPPAAISAGDI